MNLRILALMLGLAGCSKEPLGIKDTQPTIVESVLLGGHDVSITVGSVYSPPVHVENQYGELISPTPALSWSSSDLSVAVVDSAGSVTAVKAGAAVIRVRLEKASQGSGDSLVLHVGS